MSEKEALPWKKEYSFGFKVIDNQHKTILESVNKLHRAIQSGTAKNVIIDILGDLNKYAVEHFLYEEKHFESYNFPLMDDHVEEHKKFREKLNDISKNFVSRIRSDAIDKELLTFLVNWWLTHIQDVDRTYILCFKENGVS